MSSAASEQKTDQEALRREGAGTIYTGFVLGKQVQSWGQKGQEFCLES